MGLPSIVIADQARVIVERAPLSLAVGLDIPANVRIPNIHLRPFASLEYPAIRQLHPDIRFLFMPLEKPGGYIRVLVVIDARPIMVPRVVGFHPLVHWIGAVLVRGGNI